MRQGEQPGGRRPPTKWKVQMGMHPLYTGNRDSLQSTSTPCRGPCAGRSAFIRNLEMHMDHVSSNAVMLQGSFGQGAKDTVERYRPGAKCPHAAAG